MDRGIRVVLADGHRHFRFALRALLDAEPGIEVVGEAEDGRRAVELADALSPDVVVLDMHIPPMGGTGAIRHIHGTRGHPRVFAISAPCGEAFVREAYHAGASGYECKDGIFARLARSIRRVATAESPANVPAIRFGRRMKQRVLSDRKLVKLDGHAWAVGLSSAVNGVEHAANVR